MRVGTWVLSGGSVEEFKLRYSNTEKEMAWSFVVNSFFSLASMWVFLR